jgi:hypothetical protein
LATSIASRRPDVWVLDDAATDATVRDHASPLIRGPADLDRLTDRRTQTNTDERQRTRSNTAELVVTAK